MATITTLTDAQWQQVAAYRETMYQIGAACGASDREQTTQTIASMYQAIGKPPPRMVFTHSPRSTLMATQIGDQLWDQLRNQLWDQLGVQLGNQLGDQLRDQLWVQLWDQLWVQLRNQLWDQLGHCFYGSHEAYWIAFYAIMPQFGVQYPPPLAQQLGWLETLAQSCGWWMPFQHVCVVADRPVEQYVDGQRRLHCATGPAMRFADDLCLWRWHGVRVPQQVIEAPETLTLDQIQQEANMEVQRIMVERYGWERYLEATQSTLLDSDVDGSGRGTLRGLYRTTIGGRQAAILVCTCDSTGKTFPLEVPPAVTTCRQAAGWLAQDDDLRLLVQS